MPKKELRLKNKSQHPDGTVNKDKAEALAYEKEHHH